MRRLALAGSQDIQIRNLAIDLTAGLQQKDFEREACACLEFVRDRVRYVRDIRTVEVLQYPMVTIIQNAGDCDDKAILLAALLASIGHRVRFIAISYLPDKFSHVWLQTNAHGRWIDLEATEPIECGQRVPSRGAHRHMVLEL